MPCFRVANHGRVALSATGCRGGKQSDLIGARCSPHPPPGSVRPCGSSPHETDCLAAASRWWSYLAPRTVLGNRTVAVSPLWRFLTLPLELIGKLPRALTSSSLLRDELPLDEKNQAVPLAASCLKQYFAVFIPPRCAEPPRCRLAESFPTVTIGRTGWRGRGAGLSEACCPARLANTVAAASNRLFISRSRSVHSDDLLPPCRSNDHAIHNRNRILRGFPNENGPARPPLGRSINSVTIPFGAASNWNTTREFLGGTLYKLGVGRKG